MPRLRILPGEVAIISESLRMWLLSQITLRFNVNAGPVIHCSLPTQDRSTVIGGPPIEFWREGDLVHSVHVPLSLSPYF